MASKGKYTTFEPTANDKEDIGISSTTKLKKNYGFPPGLDKDTLFSNFKKELDAVKDTGQSIKDKKVSKVQVPEFPAEIATPRYDQRAPSKNYIDPDTHDYPFLLVISPLTASIAAGLTQAFTATITRGNVTISNVTLTAIWSSSDEAVATMSGSIATGVSASIATITAQHASLSSSATLTVTPAYIEEIIVSPVTASIASGLTQAFTASAYYTDNTVTDITLSASWSSSNNAVATVSGNIATGVSASAATITALFDAVTGSAVLTVSPAEAVSVTVSPVTASIYVGLTQTFTASALFTDNTIIDVTLSASWSSSDEAVATMSGSIATGVSASVATITAQYVSLSSSATLTVIPDAPETLASYVLGWYRSDDIAYDSNVPPRISTVYDKSGNGRHLYQSADSNKPTLETSVSLLNGHDSFNFNGSNQFMTGSIWNLAGQSGVGYTIFTVFIPQSWDTDGVWDLSHATNTNQYAHLMHESGKIRVRYVSAAVISWTDPTLNQPTYITVNLATGSANNGEAWEKGVSVGSTTTDNTYFLPNNIRIGSLFEDVYYFQAKYAELIICSGTLPAASRLAIEAYLAQRYNIT